MIKEVCNIMAESQRPEIRESSDERRYANSANTASRQRTFHHTTAFSIDVACRGFRLPTA
jgi:hypothetical protein